MVQPLKKSKRELNKERMRERIYQVSMKLFKRHGYQEVTVSDICREAGIARATFFSYFPQKSALIVALGKAIVTDARQQIVVGKKSAKRTLIDLTELIFKHWSENDEVLQVMLKEFLNQPLLLKESAEENMDLYFIFIEIIRDGQSKGEFNKKLSAEIAAFSLLASSSHLAAAWSSFGGAIDYQFASREILKVILNGLEVRD